MINHISDYLNGYLKLKYTGKEGVRFINLCRNNHLKLWQILKTRDQEQWTFFTSLDSFYRMRGIRKKCMGTLQITEKKGLVFRIRKYQKRFLFLLGVFLFFFMIKWISMYIWSISFEGNYSYTKEEMLRFLEENHIHSGLSKTRLDCEMIEFMLRKQYPDITWVSAELKGTKLIIHLKENFDTNIAKMEKNPYNIVSDADGQIDSIITRSGIPLVKSGDTVEEGQLLVSGSITLYNDAREVTGYEYVNADADIYAIMTIPYCERIPIEYTKKVYTGRTNHAIRLNLPGKSINLSGLFKKIKVYDEVKDYHQISLAGCLELPISYWHMKYREYQTESCVYSEEQARMLAREKFQSDIENLQEKGIQILKKDVTIKITGENCLTEGTLTIRQKIGKLQYIEPTPDS